MLSYLAVQPPFYIQILVDHQIAKLFHIASVICKSTVHKIYQVHIVRGL